MNPGIEASPDSFSPWATITTIDKGGPADRAGLRVGDRVNDREFSFYDRWQNRAAGYNLWIPFGHPVRVIVHRGARQFVAMIVPEREKGSWSAIFSTAGTGKVWSDCVTYFAFLWGIVFAGFLAARRPGDLKARLISLILLAYFGVGLFTDVVTPWWPAVDVVVVALSMVIQLSVPMALFALLMASFGHPLSSLRRLLTGLTIGLAAIAGTFGAILPMLFIWVLALPYPSMLETLPPELEILVALLCGALAVASSRGEERQQAAWMLAAIGPYWLISGLYGLALPVLLAQPPLFQFMYLLVNVLSILMPIGLTYAVLSRRVIDTGYIINRTAVFAAISVVVLGVFVLVEWALTTWVGNIRHTTSIVVNVIVALALGLSIRPIHRRVEYVIDRVFFRKRHEDETALRQFAHEATFITNADTLLDRTVEEVKQHADLDHVGVLVQNGAGTFDLARGDIASKSVDENDPAMVTMRASHEPVDLQRYQTAIDGDRAYPLVARGSMLGVLVCGNRNTHEPYAPDEAEALERLAHGVGLALDRLRDGRADGLAGVQVTLSQILDKLQVLIDLNGSSRKMDPNAK